MTFPDAVHTCFRKYADFRGRGSRSEFWWFMLALWLCMVIAMVSDSSGNFGQLVLLVFILPNAAAAVRRLHDTGRSGWYVFLLGINLYFLALPGMGGENRYGSAPAA